MQAEAGMLEAKAGMAEALSPIIGAFDGLQNSMQAIEQRISQPKRGRATLSDGTIVMLEQQ